jgi:hypothetical protein
MVGITMCYMRRWSAESSGWSAVRVVLVCLLRLLTGSDGCSWPTAWLGFITLLPTVFSWWDLLGPVFKDSHGRASRRKVVRTQLIHERRRMFVIARLTWKESSTGRKRCLLPILNTIGFRMWRAWNFYDVIIRTKGDGGSWLPGWRGRNPWLEGRGVCSQFWTPSAFGCDVHGISDVVNTISLCSYV